MSSIRVAIVSLGGLEYAALEADQQWTGSQLLQHVFSTSVPTPSEATAWETTAAKVATPPATAGIPPFGLDRVNSSCSLASSTMSPSSSSSSAATIRPPTETDSDIGPAPASKHMAGASHLPQGYGAHLLYGEMKVDLSATLAANGIPDGALLTLVKSRMDISVALGFQDGSVSVWNAETGELQHQFEGHWAAVTSLEISPDGKSVLTTSKDRSCRLWSMQTGQCSRSLGSLGALMTSTFVGSEEVITISETLGASSIVRKWCLSSGRCLRVFDSNPAYIFSAQATKCGTTLLTDKKSARLCGGGGSGLAPRNCIWCLPSDLGQVTSSKQTPDAGIVALGASSGAVQVWDTQRGECMFTLNGHSAPIGHMDISEDGRFLMTASNDGALKIWCLTRGLLCSSHTVLPTGPAPVFAPTSDAVLLVDGQGHVQIWPLGADDFFRSIQCPEGKADVAAFSPDGALLLTVSGPQSTARIWDWVAGEERFCLSNGLPVSSTAIGWTRSS